MALFAELRRRNVLKVALLYAVACWLIVWFVEVSVPTWTNAFTYFVLAVGYPVALWFAWTYEITPGGLKKASDVDQTQSIVYKTGQKLNSAVAVLLVLGVLAVFGQRLLPTFEFLVPGIPEGGAPASADVPADIRSLTLDNGLKIIVWPDHDIPNVVMYNFVRAGGRNEYPGITGLSHFFEHMMFLGTSNLEPGEFDRTMEAAGGANNAYTSSDLTVYIDWFPVSALETIFEIEADRFQNIDNDNFSRLAEQMRATAFVAHPYQFPVIGWPSDIASWTEDDLRSYYETYYAPNNRTVVIAGDVTPKQIFRLADKYFAPVPAQEPPPSVDTVEPPQMGERRIVVETPAQTPLLHIAFHAGRASDPQSLPLNLLLSILADGDSSRLHRLLVEDARTALSVGARLDKGFDPGLAYFYLTLPPGGDPDLVERQLLDALAAVVAEGVSEAELEKARNIVLADFWRALSTISGKARAVGDFEVFHGNYEELFGLPSRLEAVTVGDLQAAAAAVFDNDNMTVGVLRSPDEDGAL